MITLAGIYHDHPRAVERDLLALGYHMTDLGTRLTLSELASVVLAAPPHTAVRDAVEKGWTLTNHLIANLTEQGAGLITIGHRYQRPGVETETVAPEVSEQTIMSGEVAINPVTSVEEFEAKRVAAQAAARKRAQAS